MYPGIHAHRTPEKPACIFVDSGVVQTYRQLDEGSLRIAKLLRSRGLGPGSSLAILVENHPRFFEVVWAAQRSGLRYTAINTRLTAPEVEYIVRDCGARALVGSATLRSTADELTDVLHDLHLLMLRSRSDLSLAPGWEYLDDLAATFPAEPLDDEQEGIDMLYSSGTTGRPKGVRRPLSGDPLGTEPPNFRQFVERYSVTRDAVYLSPAPLHHAAPLRFNLAMQRMGATCVVLEHFDPEQALRAIEQQQVTHSQWVPTMFVRMLKLPTEDRDRYDLSSHRVAVHAAAPCPIEVKRRMIDWWGPILLEYYAGTEGNGSTFITSEEWLEHPGSVGRPQNVVVHVTDDEGEELPIGEPGTIWFDGGAEFEYHNDSMKTRESRHPRGWSTLGDVGYLDDDGYLYLTDRKAHMIIRGGVNVYPQEAENVLVSHPAVLDCAVVGVPDADLGERVKAVVQLVDGGAPSRDLAVELVEFCRSRLAKFKCPETVDFVDELPRHPTGKLYKRLLADRYRGEGDTTIV